MGEGLRALQFQNAVEVADVAIQAAPGVVRLAGEKAGAMRYKTCDSFKRGERGWLHVSPALNVIRLGEVFIERQAAQALTGETQAQIAPRSEERRVGKEGRSR